MADAKQTIRRVNQLPATLEANTMYVVKAPGALTADLVFTGSDPTVTAKTVSRIDVEQIVGTAVDASTSVYFKQAYGDMLTDRPKANGLVYVADTTGDPTATTSTRVYLYNKALNTFMGFPNSGGGGSTDVTWNQILGKPASTPAQIDQAVAQMHTHTNKVVLDMIGENASQKLTFRGAQVDTPSPVTFTATW